MFRRPLIKEKKDCFRRLYVDRSANNIEKYKMAKKATKRAMSEARGTTTYGEIQGAKKDLHMVFIDLEKAYDKILRNVMWWALEKHKVLAKYITLIKDMCDNVVISVRTSDDDTDDFPIKIGLHQGPALSPYLFDFVMDEVTRDMQGDIPWCMLFAMMWC
jgi:hypothetical protein